MKISAMLPSTYLKQDDIDQPYIVTVKKLEYKNIAKDDDTPERKWLVHFAEFDKAMVLNSTNIQLLAKACKSEETDDWIGQEVIVYTDPSISYGGKVTGGLRIRATEAPAAAPKRTPVVAPSNDSDVPF